MRTEAWVDEQHGQHSPKSAMGSALTYAKKQRTRLSRFLEAPSSRSTTTTLTEGAWAAGDPHPVSDDNAFAEAIMRTIKHSPAYPERPFADLAEAEAWARVIVLFYHPPVSPPPMGGVDHAADPSRPRGDNRAGGSPFKALDLDPPPQ